MSHKLPSQKKKENKKETSPLTQASTGQRGPNSGGGPHSTVTAHRHAAASSRNLHVCCPMWGMMVHTPIRRALTGSQQHHHASSPQFSSVAQSCPTLCNPMDCSTPGLCVSITISQSLLKLMPSNHLILCRPLLLLPSIFPSIRVFCNESVLRIRWPKY